MGADEVIDFTEEDPVAAIKRLTEGRGVDVAIEALGQQETFQACLDATRPGGRISSLGVYGGKLEIPVESYVYGIGDKQILSTLCPGGKERMRKLMEMVRHGRLDLSPLITHRFGLDADRGRLRAVRQPARRRGQGRDHALTGSRRRAMDTKIVIGYDGTDQANDALHLGSALARGVGAKLIVASAIEFGPIQSGPFEIDPTGYNEARVQHYENVFKRASAELGGADFERRELQDTAAHGLTDLAESEAADLIVLGSTHHGPIGRVLAGTVAGGLLHGAPCAVMVAPRGWSQRDHAKIGLIGVGYDGSDESKVALARAEELAKAFDADLRVITIAPYIGPRGEFEPVEERRKLWAETVTEGARSVSDDIEVERVLRQGREATELALQGVDLDLLLVGSRGYGPLRRTLVGSVAGELVRTSPCPVLVVPRGAAARATAEQHPEVAAA